MIAFFSGANSIELPDPELQDSERTHIKVTVNRTMDGQMVTHRHTPSSRTFILSLQALTRRKAEELRAYLVDTMGTRTRFLHFDNTQWRGFFSTSTYELITDARGLSNLGRAEFSSITLEFEGVQI